jgi:hypothetical protein
MLFIESVPPRGRFWKYSHLRDKRGGADTNQDCADPKTAQHFRKFTPARMMGELRILIGEVRDMLRDYSCTRVQLYLSTTGCFKTISIIAQCSSTAQNYPVDLISIKIQPSLGFGVISWGCVRVVSQRTPWGVPQKLKNNTGFGVTSCKSARAALAGSDRDRYQYRY